MEDRARATKTLLTCSGATGRRGTEDYNRDARIAGQRRSFRLDGSAPIGDGHLLVPRYRATPCDISGGVAIASSPHPGTAPCPLRRHRVRKLLWDLCLATITLPLAPPTYPSQWRRRNAWNELRGSELSRLSIFPRLCWELQIIRIIVIGATIRRDCVEKTCNTILENIQCCLENEV